MLVGSGLMKVLIAGLLLGGLAAIVAFTQKK